MATSKQNETSVQFSLGELFQIEADRRRGEEVKARALAEQVGGVGVSQLVGLDLWQPEFAQKYAAVRAELKANKDYAGLSQLPRNASPTRVVNRCKVSGRRRAFIRRFKVSRLVFRELASAGLIPGVTKSSW